MFLFKCSSVFASFCFVCCPNQIFVSCQFYCFRSSLLAVCLCVCVCVCVCYGVCLCASARRALCSGCRRDMFGYECFFLLQRWRHRVIQKSRRGGRSSHCAESENYYASFKDRLHCCSTGTPLCSRSVTQCLFTNAPLCESRRFLQSLLCCGAVEAACIEECMFIASRYLVMVVWDEEEVVTAQTITQHGNAGNSSCHRQQVICLMP